MPFGLVVNILGWVKNTTLTTLRRLGGFNIGCIRPVYEFCVRNNGTMMNDIASEFLLYFIFQWLSLIRKVNTSRTLYFRNQLSRKYRAQRRKRRLVNSYTLAMSASSRERKNRLVDFYSACTHFAAGYLLSFFQID